MRSTGTKKLLASIKRAKGNPSIPLSPYDDETIRAIVAECRTLHDEILELMKGEDTKLDELSDGLKSTLVIRHQTILRNKQCTLAYLQHRLEALCALRLEVGLNVPEKIRENTSQLEAAFLTDYDKILSDYMRAVDLDLTASQRPPKDLFVEVRANTDCGEIVTEQSGVVDLAKGTSHYLRAADVEDLVKQGLLEHVG
ncbi:hypothetical protein CTAYLR_001245 [Chrysophaeum taylorii]|uniref:DNA replication complex GINS protein PSF1 n=1 Tax=Chrysophaeum taylorii TaxID=2483200 RepID=A0AAD7XNL8_9STRA|nr:hypothetical protein CTAYLR_001245 [Chrysophaeum taylorii]